MRKSVKRALGLTAIAGLGYAAWRSYAKRGAGEVAPGLNWEPQPFPFPPQPVRTTPPVSVTEAAELADGDPADAIPAWVEPNDDGSCPDGYPVKAKVASGIFHVEGGRNYARTKPDRCYATAEAAEADGLRQSKT
ncbi:MAG: hypothetical protein U0W40_05835 [Acidimicrobiia bacterium]